MNHQDLLWEHFSPLWIDLTGVSNDILLAGGYGLFLKQQWFAEGEPTVPAIPLESWEDATPRVTKDIDLVIGLDLIANETENKRIMQILDGHGFRVSEKSTGKRWQFVKKLEDDQEVITELHAPTPGDEALSLKSDRIRVKHNPSLGEQGVHGRHNKEAVGCELHPFQLTKSNLRINLPNPVTWSIMKLTATKDQWDKYTTPDTSSKDRTFFREQALKHGNDVCRIIALMTEEERDASMHVVETVRDSHRFEHAASVYRDIFSSEADWVKTFLVDSWSGESLAIICQLMDEWYVSK